MKTYDNQSQWDNATPEDEEYDLAYDNEIVKRLWEMAEDGDASPAYLFLRYLRHVDAEGVDDDFDRVIRILASVAKKDLGPSKRGDLWNLIQNAFEWDAQK